MARAGPLNSRPVLIPQSGLQFKNVAATDGEIQTGMLSFIEVDGGAVPSALF